jgi:hypothetical protein
VMVTSPIVSCFMVSLCFPQSVLRLLPSGSWRLIKSVENRFDRLIAMNAIQLGHAAVKSKGDGLEV